MASNFLKPTKIVNTALALLARELTLPGLVWRDAAGDFAGVLNDTISIRLPAYAKARTRALRSGDSRTRDDLNERKVDVTLDTDVYKDVRISDEQLTLDITDFGTQVLNPVLAGIARRLEEELAQTMRDATYELEVEFDPVGDGPYHTAVAARKALNDARVPFGGRSLVVGSTLEAAFLNSPQFVRADHAGDTAAVSAMQEAKIGRVAGFDVYPSPGIAPEEGYAFHKTAYVLSSRAPVVPAGAPYGASASQGGFAVRVVRVLDSEAIEDVLATDSWVGTNVVTDNGTIAEDGTFEPSEDPEDSDADDLFVRAVKLTQASS